MVDPTTEQVTPTIEELSIEQTTQKMQEMFIDTEVANLAEAAIQNNQIVFELDGSKYRVRKATFQEKQQVNMHRRSRFIACLKETDCLLEKDLRKLYQEKGIDIDAMDKQILEATHQQQKLLLELGKAIKDNKIESELQKYKEEIVNLNATIKEVSTEKGRLLEYSLENSVLIELYGYMIWLISEKQVNDKWSRIWNTYDDFLQTEPSDLLLLITKNGALMINEELNVTNLT